MKNNNEASIKFPFIQFEKPGIYQYNIKETTESGDGWVTDSMEYPVIVTITDDGKGNLESNVDYPEGMPKFVNTYTPTPILVDLIGEKKTIGAPLREGQFRFGVFDEDGNEIVSATNDAPEEE
ncbi:MAG: hypothetical protein FWC41_12195 [Firmicutes bacterium]|nr:hypothetical protein [Bacillota bacterium]